MTIMFSLKAPSLVRPARDFDPQSGRGIATRIGHLDPSYKLTGDPSTDDALADRVCRPKRRAWMDKSTPRFVTIGEDTKTVYTWPMGWVNCTDEAFGTYVRRVGRLVDGFFIRDGHHFLEALGVRVNP